MDYKKTFIELAINKDALKFGSFKLKSERISPFFSIVVYFQMENLYLLLVIYSWS